MTLDDMRSAVEWLRSYDAAPDDLNGERCFRVADWLETEMQRRIETALQRRVETAAIRQLAKECGSSTAAIKAALKRKREA